MNVAADVINQIRPEDARRFKVVPVGFGETGLIVAVSDPLDIDTIDSLSFLLQREIELVCSSPEKIREALVKYYGTADDAADILQQQIGEDVDLGFELSENAEGAEGDAADAPIIRMVSMLLIEAHRAGASDIHLEPLDKKFRVRFRHRWRAPGNAGSAEAFAVSHCQPHQNHERLHEHRRETTPAGRPHPGKD